MHLSLLAAKMHPPSFLFHYQEIWLDPTPLGEEQKSDMFLGYLQVFQHQVLSKEEDEKINCNPTFKGLDSTEAQS